MALENSGQQQQQEYHKALDRNYRSTGQKVPYPPQNRYNKASTPATMKAVDVKPLAAMKAVYENPLA